MDCGESGGNGSHVVRQVRMETMGLVSGLLIGIGVIVFLMLVLTWSLCKISSESDKGLDKMRKK